MQPSVHIGCDVHQLVSVALLLLLFNII